MRLISILILTSACLVFCSPVWADTPVSGSISADTTWTLAGSPYVVTANVTVATAKTLTIDPGVIVKFNSGTTLTIQGTLSAVGTSASPITFTSSAVSPTRGSWGQIDFQGGTNPASQLSYATVSYAGAFNGAAVRISNGTVNFDHVTVTESSQVGILSQGNNAITVSSVTISNCTSDGLRLDLGTGTLMGLHTISDSTFSGNGGYGINLQRDAHASIVNTAFVNNTAYAIGAQAGTAVDALSGITATGNGSGTKNALEYRSGTVSARDETWRASALAWVFTGGATVGSGRTVTVEPGSTLKFASGTILTVQGIVIAAGTTSNPIVFTSNAASPTRGSWGMIDFQGATTPASQISYATVSYAGNNGYAVHIASGTLNLDHITVTESSHAGILSNTTNAITMASITVSNCTGDGLQLDYGGSSPMGSHTVTDSTFTNNGGYGINLQREAHISLTNATLTNNTGYAIGAQPGDAIDVLTGIIATGNGSDTKNALEYRSGTVSAHDETWRASAFPWVFTSGATVGAGRNVTIEAGSTLKFATGTILTVQGILSAVGTSGSPIVFTSNAATPARGSWGMIDFQGATNPASQISYATVSYAGNNGYAVHIASGTLNLDHVTVTESSHAGIASNTTDAISMSSITVSNCTGDGLQLDYGGASLMGLQTVADSTFTNNGGYGINLQRQGHISVTNTSLTNNAGYAMGSQPGSAVDVLTGITATGNGSGTKNGLEYRNGTVGARDETWRASALPWALTGGATVGTGRTVSIEAGSTIKFGTGAILYVQGALSAIGTTAAPITFTSNASTPTRGSWGMIEVQGGSNPASQISYATVSYSGNNGYALHVVNGTLNVDHVTVTESSRSGIGALTIGNLNMAFVTINNCSSHGITIDDAGASTGLVTISDTTVANNGAWGLNAGTNSTAVIRQTTFSGNTSGGATSSSAAVDAAMCYWSNATGPSGSGFGTGQSVNANVKFEPWLASSPTTVQRFTTVAVRNRKFNPTIAAVSRIATTMNNAGNWTLVFSNSGSTVVRTFTGSGSSADTAWDGNDQNGLPQPNGTYTYEFQSTNGADSAAPLRGRAIIDTARQLTVTGYAATPVYISPNNDGIQDSSAIAAAVNYDDDAWTLQIKNPSGTVVRNVAGTGNVSFTWDGRDGNGVLQPDAVYNADTTVTEGTSSANLSATVTLDATPPVATMTAPGATQLLSNFYQNGSADVSVIGTINDANLTNWILDFSNATVGWTTIATSTAPVANAQIGLWYTLPYTNGVFNLRLRAWDRAGTLTTTTATPTVANFKITQSAYMFNPGANGTLTYTSIVPFPLTETLTIRNQSGTLVKTLVNASRAAGTYNDAWNGRSDASLLMPDGPYSYTASVTDGSTTMLWDRSAVMRSATVTAAYPGAPAVYDPFNNKPFSFTYTLNDAFRASVEVSPIRLAFGSDCPALLQAYGTRCFDPWHYEAGPRRVSFWGTDTDGSFLPGTTALNVIFRQDNFPENVAVVYGTTPAISNERVDPALFNPAAGDPSVNSPTAGTQTISFTLSTYQNQPVAVVVQVVNQSSHSNLRTITIPSQSPGSVAITWDGRADNGMRVAEGYYTLMVTATDSLGNTTTQHLVTTIRY